MSNDPDQIRADIEATRSRLSADVDTLTDEVNPKTIARRKVDDLKEAGAGVRDKIMGSAHDAGGSAQDTVATLQDKVSDAPGAVRARAQGNPLAAGLIAFGAGMLVASLIPVSEQERQVASTVKAKAEPVKEQLTEVAKDVADNLKQPAQEAVAAVQQTATEGAQNVKGEGQSAVQDVQEQAQASKDTVQNG